MYQGDGYPVIPPRRTPSGISKPDLESSGSSGPWIHRGQLPANLPLQFKKAQCNNDNVTNFLVQTLKNKDCNAHDSEIDMVASILLQEMILNSFYYKL